MRGFPRTMLSVCWRVGIHVSLLERRVFSEKMDARSARNAPGRSEHCSILISNLPEEWFQLEEDGKVSISLWLWSIAIVFHCQQRLEK